MPAPQNLRATGDRIEQVLDELQATADPRIVDLAEELLRLVSELYGGGLARVVELAREQAPGLIGALVDDELVASLLLVHGLHPDALDRPGGRRTGSVRPLLAAHGGDVELLGIDEDAGAVLLRLLGSCDGCPSSAGTLQGAVEGAIVEAAPEIVRIVVEAPADPHSRPRSLWRSLPSRCTTNARRRWSARDRSAGRAAADPRAVRSRSPGRGSSASLCAEPVPDEHGHLVDLQARTLLCACRGCYLLFISEGAGGSHFRAVPDRYLAFSDFELSSAQWDTLQIPVSVAFFFLNSSLGGWRRSTRDRPAPPSRSSRSTRGTRCSARAETLRTLEPDVEAFLVRAGTPEAIRSIAR